MTSNCLRKKERGMRVGGEGRGGEGRGGGETHCGQGKESSAHYQGGYNSA